MSFGVRPPRCLATTHWSPLSGAEDLPENYRDVRYKLAEQDGVTTVTLTHGNSPSREGAESMAVLEDIERIVVEASGRG